MYIYVRNLLRKLFLFFNLGLVKDKDLKNLHQIFIDHTCLVNKLNFYFFFQKSLSELGNKLSLSENVLLNSKSQNGQDFFALIANDFKKGGVFIEFGAYDGVIFSNTLLLEREFGWTGVLIDPIPTHFERMQMNRNCKLIHGAITPKPQDSIMIEELPASDLSKFTDKRSVLKKTHKVKAYTLQALIEENLKSKKIDFLSIDIEGHDFEVLKSLDLNRYKIKAICVEHNFRKDSAEIVGYMERHGYKLVFSEFSKNDYWFVANV